jgi:hypothetical protein
MTIIPSKSKGEQVIDNEIVMAILIGWSKTRTPKTYSDLSNEYMGKTGEWYEPHGSWDVPLGQLNNSLAEQGAPAISALVLLKGKNEPGGNFWGCAPNVPDRPGGEMLRLAKWNEILEAVFSYEWE